MSDNPIQSQTPGNEPSGDARHEPVHPKAAFGKRFINSLVDGIFLLVLIGIADFVIRPLLLGQPNSGEQLSPVMMITSYAISAFIIFAYFTICESCLQGRTIGKFLSGTKVICNKSGISPTFGQVVIRSLTRLIPFEALTILAGDQKTCFHDSTSKTRVVDINQNLRAGGARPETIDKIEF